MFTFPSTLVDSQTLYAVSNTGAVDFEFDSSQSALISDVSQNGALDVTGAITIECWLKIESFPGNTGVLSKWGSGAAIQRSWYLMFVSQTGWRFALWDQANGLNPIAAWDPGVTTGVWYHLAWTHDPNIAAPKFEMFKNGTSLGKQDSFAHADIGLINNGTGDFNVGASSTNIGVPANFFDGKIDEVRIWNVIRTQTQINDNKAIELVGNESGLVGYWKLNGDFTDSTSNGNHLSGYNGPAFTTDVPF